MKYPENESYLPATNMNLKNQKDAINNFPFFGASVDHFGKGQQILEAKLKEQNYKKIVCFCFKHCKFL